MTWRDRLGPAYFRGVQFFVETAEYVGGRRTVRHEFPLRDEPFSEDLGRKGRDFPVEGYVVGSDYMEQRDALIAALEKIGPGELVHPYYGVRTVVSSGFRIRESKQDGGMAVFSITFEETPVQPASPSTSVDATALVKANAVNVRSSIGAEFLAKYNPGALTASSADAIRALTLSVDNARSLASLTTEEAASMRRRLDRLASSVAVLVTSPSGVLSEILGLLSAVTSVEAAIRAYSFEPGLRPPETTATRRQERANYDALVALVRVVSAVRAAELAVDETYDSFDAAVAQRDSVSNMLDEQSSEVSDDTYTKLQQLRADLVKAVPGSDSDLPRIVRYVPAVTISSLALVYRLYGDLARETDVLDRNSVRHPGFVTGGSVLEVLSDA